ncbi:hypothetical protein [Flavilitoribacter nigricans]|uniref:Uncharacterized protein n=1 Tax=Flavilitoribacter nigricans (strain ATCC 23147 / DSM 23189 / NBRC 102662 / NCIMB 1420 / SS-2) TaxID=1122177 RepID=A0A2D0N1J4_FLAN2|nr:hypothetical protein [Flavilitoribacter nigricans]PHN02401.1 hypothetical protein CRP01_31970 [Flavilitoribacter nigricans DSM 23189 = NBRC 102662]
MNAIYYQLLLGLFILTSPGIPSNFVMPAAGDTTVSGVGLGRNKKNCEGKGICIIGSELKIAGIGDRQTIARLNFSKQSLGSMSISYSDLTEGARRTFFSEKYFLMEEAYSGTLKVKDRAYEIKIPAGKYPIVKEEKGLRVDFKL